MLDGKLQRAYIVYIMFSVSNLLVRKLVMYDLYDDNSYFTLVMFRFTRFEY